MLSVASLLLLAGSANATSIGYSKDKIVRTYIFRMGSTKTQGQAIRLSKAKLQALKGKTIDFAEFVVASRNTTGNKLHAFITTSLGGTPIAEGDVDITKSLERMKFTLPIPYTITGEEENLYIGYTAEIPVSYKLLMGDGSYDINGCNFAYQDGEWVDTYGTGRGSAYITVNVDGASDYADAIMSQTNFGGYYLAGSEYDFSTRFINAGTTTINSFDAVINIDGKETTQHFSDVNIKAKGSYSFKLPGINSDTEGSKDVSVKIANVNGDGADGVEYDTSDNHTEGTVFFYPSNMERSILADAFTGQDCKGCPDGHRVLESAISMAKDAGINVVEVNHHAGYYPDVFTMMEDAAYLFYYNNPARTFAPAMMANRNVDPAVSTLTPVTDMDLAKVAKLISHAAEEKPYVSLNLETSYDKDTRELKYKLGIKPHAMLPTDKTIYNIFLVQDGIKAYQASGGSDYTHSMVFRGALTGNAWGKQLDNLKPCEVYTTKEATYTLPECIHSSFYTDDMLQTIDGEQVYVYNGKGANIQYTPSELNIATDPDNMYLVAYVGEYDTDDKTKNAVFNCVEAKLGESYKQAAFDNAAGIENVGDTVKRAGIHVKDGKIGVDGKCDRLYVYNIAGRQVEPDGNLASGIYVVKAVCGGTQTTKKIIVR